MNKYTEMRKTRLKVETTHMTLAGAVQWAKEHIPAQTGWILAEAPEIIAWLPLSKLDETAIPDATLSLAAFAPDVELRFQRDYGAPTGHTRLVTVDPQGEEGIERISFYLLGSRGTLQYAEFFRTDEASGMPQLVLARYCNVGGGNGI